MVSDRTRPTASARGQPKVISAWRFHSVMRPSALMATKASWALSRMRRWRSSLVRSTASACLSSVISVQVPNHLKMRPWLSRMGVPRVLNQR